MPARLGGDALVGDEGHRYSSIPLGTKMKIAGVLAVLLLFITQCKLKRGSRNLHVR